MEHTSNEKQGLKWSPIRDLLPKPGPQRATILKKGENLKESCPTIENDREKLLTKT